MRLLLAGALLAGAAVVLNGQVPGRPAATRSIGHATEIIGRVADTDGRAVSTASVRLVGLASVRTVVTDARGRFAFPNIVPGEYVVTARKHGFFDGAFGKRRPGGDPVPVSLAAGHSIADMQIELFRAGVITGSVLDEASEPVIGARVVAMRRMFADGEWQYLPAGTDVTNDQGTYRVYGLEPGEYLVSTPTTQAAAELRADRVFVSDLPLTEDVTLAYPTLFYPASRYFLLAQPVHLSSGEVKYAINFQWSPVAARAVRGRLIGISEATADQLVKLVPAGSHEVGLGNDAAVTITGLDGSFVLDRVPAGEYRLEAGRGFRADPGLPSEVFWGRATVNVTDEDIRGLAVTMRMGFSLSGSVIAPRPTASVAPFAPERIAITIVPVQPGLSPATTPRILANGAFAASNLIPGEYYVRVGRLPVGWYVTSVTHASRNLLDEPADISDADASGIVITVTDRPTTILGSVRDGRLQAASGAAVIVMPASVDQWSPHRSKQTRASTNGQFVFSGLPPGDYLIVALDDAVSEGWQDRAVLTQLRTVATRLTLRTEESRTLQLRLSVVRR